MKNRLFAIVIAGATLSLTACDNSQVTDEVATEQVAKPNAVLDPLGIKLPSIEGGTDQLIAFGMEREMVAVVVSEYLELTGTNGNNEECGAGPMKFVTFGDLTLNFQNDKFVGWFVDGPNPVLKTREVVGVGSIKGTAEAQMPVDIQEDSTLGIEFLSNRGENSFIGGFLTASDENGMIESLYAGTNCFFR